MNNHEIIHSVSMYDYFLTDFHYKFSLSIYKFTYSNGNIQLKINGLHGL